jgi:hypothetical protein
MLGAGVFWRPRPELNRGKRRWFYGCRRGALKVGELQFVRSGRRVNVGDVHRPDIDRGTRFTTNSRVANMLAAVSLSRLPECGKTAIMTTGGS